MGLATPRSDAAGWQLALEVWPEHGLPEMAVGYQYCPLTATRLWVLHWFAPSSSPEGRAGAGDQQPGPFPAGRESRRLWVCRRNRSPTRSVYTHRGAGGSAGPGAEGQQGTRPPGAALKGRQRERPAGMSPERGRGCDPSEPGMETAPWCDPSISRQLFQNPSRAWVTSPQTLMGCPCPSPPLPPLPWVWAKWGGGPVTGP